MRRRIAWLVILLALAIAAIAWRTRAPVAGAGEDAGAVDPVSAGAPRPDARTSARPSAPPSAPASAPAPASAAVAAPLDDSRVEPPSAACLAARQRQADEREQLDALSPEVLSAEIEAVARADVEAEAAQQQALRDCGHLEDEAMSRCLGQRGVETSRQTDVEGQRDQEIVAEALRGVARGVAARGDARSLVVASAMTPLRLDTDAEGAWRSRVDPEEMQWLIRAARMAPDDELVQWQVASFQTTRDQPAPPDLVRAQQAARMRLRALDPDNAAYFLLDATDEVPGQQDLSPGQVQEAAAYARHETPTAEVMRLVLAAGSEAALPSEAVAAMRRGAAAQGDAEDTRSAADVACAGEADLAQLHVLTWSVMKLGARTRPTPLVTCLRPAAPAVAAPRPEDCAALARLLADSSWLNQSLAAEVGERHATGAAREDWRQLRRRQRWQQSQMQHLEQLRLPVASARVFAQAWTDGGEHLALERILQATGIPLDPPADWRPPGG